MTVFGGIKTEHAYYAVQAKSGFMSWRTLAWKTAKEIDRIIWWSKEYISESFREWRRLPVIVRLWWELEQLNNNKMLGGRTERAAVYRWEVVRIDGDLMPQKKPKKFVNSIFRDFEILGPSVKYQDPFQSRLRYFSPQLCASWESTHWLFKRLRLGVNFFI